MNLFTKLKDWLMSAISQLKAQKELKRQNSLKRLSCTDINVVEFNGRLYIAYQGVPVVRVDDLKVKAPELLSQAREDYLMWKELFDR